MEALVEVSSLSVSFGAVRAVDDVSLRLAAGSVHGLVGPNGSGKSTLLNALTGLVPSWGRVHVDGKEIRYRRAGHSRAAGILRTFQNPQTFGNLTCLENVLLSLEDRAASGFLSAVLGRGRMNAHERTRWRAAESAMSALGIESLAQTKAAGLSYGQQRWLELARVLAAEPRVVLLDEPSAGLNDVETQQLAAVLEEMRDSGVAVLLVDHKVDFVDGLSSLVTVLDHGSVIASAAPADIWVDDRVVSAYLGAAPDA